EVPFLVRRLEPGRRLAQEAPSLRISRLRPIRRVVELLPEHADFLRKVSPVRLREGVLERPDPFLERLHLLGVRTIRSLWNRTELRLQSLQLGRIRDSASFQYSAR